MLWRLSIVSHISKSGKALDWSEIYKCSWRSRKWSQKKNKPKINYLLNSLLIWCLPCLRSISYKIPFFFLSCFHLHWCIVLLWLKRTILLVLVFHFDYPAVLVFFRAGRLYITCRIFCSMGISSKGGTPFFGPEQGMFFRVLDRNPLKDCKGLI